MIRMAAIHRPEKCTLIYISKITVKPGKGSAFLFSALQGFFYLDLTSLKTATTLDTRSVALSSS